MKAAPVQRHATKPRTVYAGASTPAPRRPSRSAKFRPRANSTGTVAGTRLPGKGGCSAIIFESVPAFAAVLERVLQDDLGMSVFRSVDTPSDALQLVRAYHPRMAILDFDSFVGKPRDSILSARGLSPHTSIVFAAARFSDRDILSAIEAHVRGFLLKSDTIDQIRPILRDVSAGLVAFSSGLRGQIVEHAGDKSGRRALSVPFARLTRREIEILTLVAQGLSEKEMAAALAVRPKTVASHKASISAKLNIHDRVLLTHYAIREGLVSI